MYELITEYDLSDGQSVDMAGYDLIVDMVTCGSQDPNMTRGSLYHDISAYNIGITLSNSGNTANLEFKDWSGIKVNASLPSNINLYVDPNNPLPDKFSGDSSTWPYQDDPYRTNLYANARAELLLNHNEIAVQGKTNIPSKVREGEWYSTVKSKTTNTITFEKNLNLHIGDRIIEINDGQLLATIISYTNKTATIDKNDTRWGTYVIQGGGFCIRRLNGMGKSSYFFSNQVNVGHLNTVVNTWYGNNYGYVISDKNKIKVDRLIMGSASSGTGSLCYQSAQIFIKEFANSSGFCTPQQNFGYYIINTETVFTGALINSIQNRYVEIGGTIFVKNANIGAFAANNSIYSGRVDLENCIVRQRTKSSICGDTAVIVAKNSTLDGQYYDGIWMELNGDVIKQNNSWHHKPKDTSSTTWKYADHFIPPHKSLHLKISRLVESTSSLSEARVAITDTANWYPEIKFGAYADIVINNIETDKWQIYNLKYKNESDEPLQVRVWECVSGSTDGGYLKVEEATGGPM